VSPYKTPAAPETHLTLIGLSRAVQEHYEEHPTHGAECACLDPMIAAISRSLLPREDDNEWRRAAVISQRTRDAVGRVFAEIGRRV
jgi:hypothetical protein